ncbi:hypothetical protein SAMN04487792_1554 [Lactobacillus bombicola]|jgi:hypothetical protein|uniref:Uncharacterized protein n=1 Tax=Lactobacillus bombicola TaxID=1505723 RepID=A0A1I1TYF3_9LACO|nr:hypothetical protein [Lactobacillus bombicola]SFD60640.1 hypothetical protein SAMN04487792_1554 [Lactobacillus bombicola]
MEHYNNWPRVIRQLESLNKHAVAIGFFGEKNSQLLTIVRANEYGAHIVPKKGQWLTIPTENVPIGSDGAPKSAKEIPGLFKPKGKNVLAFSNNDGTLTVMYYLVKEVNIPSRPFIRLALIENTEKYKHMIEQGIEDITFNGSNAIKVLTKLGVTAVADIRKSSITLSKPANAPATIARKKSSNPLVDTGNLQRSITYRII